MNDLKQNSLKRRVGGNHAFDQKQQMEQDAWLAAGRPHTWILVESQSIYEVYVDVGFGSIALFVGDVCAGVGKDCVVTDKAVALDRDCYGAAKYLWL